MLGRVAWYRPLFPVHLRLWTDWKSLNCFKIFKVQRGALKLFRDLNVQLIFASFPVLSLLFVYLLYPCNCLSFCCNDLSSLKQKASKEDAFGFLGLLTLKTILCRDFSLSFLKVWTASVFGWLSANMKWYIPVAYGLVMCSNGGLNK